MPAFATLLAFHQNAAQFAPTHHNVIGPFQLCMHLLLGQGLLHHQAHNQRQSRQSRRAMSDVVSQTEHQSLPRHILPRPLQAATALALLQSTHHVFVYVLPFVPALPQHIIGRCGFRQYLYFKPSAVTDGSGLYGRHHRHRLLQLPPTIVLAQLLLNLAWQLLPLPIQRMRIAAYQLRQIAHMLALAIGQCAPQNPCFCCHQFHACAPRIFAKVWVVEVWCSNTIDTTLPPRAWVFFAPTMFSIAQSPPFTNTCGCINSIK